MNETTTIIAPPHHRPGATPEREGPLALADRDAFADVFRRYYAPLTRYAQSLTGGEETARDVLQEVFAKLWEAREKITVRVSLQAMLYTMVRNRALNSHRRQRWAAPEVAVEDVIDHYQTTPDGLADLEAEALRLRLYAWIDKLPPRRAEAFKLSRFQGLRHSEIAAIMGVSERTVDTHILLALRELRRRLDAG